MAAAKRSRICASGGGQRASSPPSTVISAGEHREAQALTGERDYPPSRGSPRRLQPGEPTSIEVSRRVVDLGRVESRRHETIRPPLKQPR